jgi:hypothetical protein
VYQDEAVTLDLDALKEKHPGIDLQVQRVPRETVRAESILKVKKLRDKVQAMADMRGEEVSESILEKADILETTPTEELIKLVSNY